MRSIICGLSAIHPLNYALALAAAAERDGARIFENTPALSIDPSRSAQAHRHAEALGCAPTMSCCAGTSSSARLMPRLAATLLPVTTYVITTAPLGDASRRGGRLSRRGQRHRSGRQSLSHRRRRPLDVVGPLDAWARDPRRYVGALTADIKKTYPQLGDVAADYAWAGTLGITMHRMPQIGELGPGVWLASGFGGHGLNTTAMAGNIIARAIVDGDQTWRQFTPFELVWAGGAFGRAAAQMRVWIKRLRDAIAERRAKARELAHRQARDAELAMQATPQSAELAARRTGTGRAQRARTGPLVAPPADETEIGGESPMRPEPQPQNAPAGPSKRKNRRQSAKA